MNIKESIKERLLTVLVSGLTGALGVILTSIYKDAAAPFVQGVLPALDNKTLLLLSLLLFLANVALGIALAVEFLGSSKERLKRKYPTDKETGLRYDRKSCEWVCPSCFDKDDISFMRILKNQDKQRAHCNAYLCGYSRPVECDKFQT